MVPVADEMLDAELAGVPGLLGVIAGSGAIPPSEMEASAAVEAGARRHVSSPIGDMVGSGEHLERATGDDRGVKGLHILARSMARTPVGISPKRGYRTPGLPLFCPSTSC